MIRGRRVDPPHAGMRPRFTSGRPMRVDRSVARNPIVASQRQFESSARARTVNRCDRHALKRGDSGEGLLAEIDQLRPALCARQLLQVGSRNEDRSASRSRRSRRATIAAPALQASRQEREEYLSSSTLTELPGRSNRTTANVVLINMQLHRSRLQRHLKLRSVSVVDGGWVAAFISVQAKARLPALPLRIDSQGPAGTSCVEVPLKR